jgi:hypothetical protein
MKVLRSHDLHCLEDVVIVGLDDFESVILVSAAGKRR